MIFVVADRTRTPSRCTSSPWLLGLCLVSWAWLAQPALGQPSTLRSSVWTVPLIVHVANADDTASAAGVLSAVDAAFITAQLKRTNSIFAQYGVRFEIAQQKPLSAVHAQLNTREDRDRLGAYVTPGAIHCFFVASLRDVDEPERMRFGVHWRSRVHPGVRYVVVSADTDVSHVLAHELGHYLGNPKHSDVRDNLMSYEHSGALPFLDATQRKRIRRQLRRIGSTLLGARRE